MNYSPRPSTSPRLFRASKRALLSGLIVLSCTEHFPPHLDPSDVFSSSVDAVYVLNDLQNYVNLVLRVKNKYDEQLEGTAAFRGEIRISSERDPSVFRVFPLDPSMLTIARGYNAQTRRLQMNPNEEIRFETRWMFVDESGRDLRTDYFIMLDDSSCPTRCFAAQEIFRISATVNLYDRTSESSAGPTIFELCYVTGIEAGCPHVNTLPPCNQRLPTLPGCSMNTGGPS